MAFRRSGVQIPSGPLSLFAVSTCDSQGFAKRLTDEGFTIKLSDIFISLRFNSNPCCCAIRANIDCTLIKKNTVFAGDFSISYDPLSAKSLSYNFVYHRSLAGPEIRTIKFNG